MKKALIIVIALLVAGVFGGAAIAAEWICQGNVVEYAPGSVIKVKAVFHGTAQRDVNENPLPEPALWTFNITPKTKIDEKVSVGDDVRIKYTREGIPVKKLNATQITVWREPAQKGK